MKILVINGPNLNMLGKREPDIYGHETYEDVVKKIHTYCEQKELACDVFQSNHEGEIVDKLHEADEQYDGVVMNPAAFTHYSYAILDAIKAISRPVVEIHISNIHARESFRQHSVTAVAADGIVAGFGTDGYLLAIDALVGKLNK